MRDICSVPFCLLLRSIGMPSKADADTATGAPATLDDATLDVTAILQHVIDVETSLPLRGAHRTQMQDAAMSPPTTITRRTSTPIPTCKWCSCRGTIGGETRSILTMRMSICSWWRPGRPGWLERAWSRYLGKVPSVQGEQQQDDDWYWHWW